jgi:carboxyl-terminal processing protease
MRTRRILSIAAGAVLAASAAGFYLEEQSARDGARLFDQVVSLIEDRFVDSVDAGALFEKAAHGLVAELNDPYSELFSPKLTKTFNTQTGGRYGGVGMLIENQQGAIVIAKVYPNTPAEGAGIHEGDRILEIEGVTTRGTTTQEVSDKMQGVPGTTVRVRFARLGVPTPIDVTFTRATIRIPAVPFALMLADSIAYIPLQTFNETATTEVSNQLVRLQGEGAKAVILDLRENRGGFLEQSLSTANLFLKRGQEIVSVRSRGEATQKAFAEIEPVASSIPVIVMVDGSSASASEIVAGALQDHDRALIVGTTSFGKGLVQTMYALDGGWSLKLTTGKWYTPSGRSIHKPRTAAELEQADTATGPEDISKRPVFKSDAGRTVYGGGAITPDVYVRPDTITTPERVLAQKLFVKAQEVHVAVYDYSLLLKKGLRSDFKPLPEWRDELYRRVREKGVEVTKAEWDAGHEYIDRTLADQVARLAFGDSTAKRLELNDDNQLVKALELLRRGHTQQELFKLAAAQPTKSKD